MTTHNPQILDQDQFQAAVKAARERFSQLQKKHPTLKGYLVLAIPGKQTGIGSGAKEILGDLPALIVDDAAKAAFQQHLKSPPPKDAGEKVKKEWEERCEELVAELNYNGGVRIELRFDNLDYALIARLQSDELVDRELTPQTAASIRIVLGTLGSFAPLSIQDVLRGSHGIARSQRNPDLPPRLVPDPPSRPHLPVRPDGDGEDVPWPSNVTGQPTIKPEPTPV
jgi:hypothetical protein